MISESNARRKILVADDIEELRDTVCHILRGEGFIVDAARDGEECLEKIPVFEPDLLLIDVTGTGRA